MTTWMDIEGILLSEISQTERQIPHELIYMWNLKNKTKGKQTYIYKKQTGGCQKGWWREG